MYISVHHDPWILAAYPENDTIDVYENSSFLPTTAAWPAWGAPCLAASLAALSAA